MTLNPLLQPSGEEMGHALKALMARMERQRAGFAVKSAKNTGPLTLSQTVTQVPGVSVPIVLNSADSIVVATQSLVIDASAGLSLQGSIQAFIGLDGVTQTDSELRMFSSHTDTLTLTLANTTVYTGLAAGSHTWDVRARKVNNAGTSQITWAVLTLLLIDR